MVAKFKQRILEVPCKKDIERFLKHHGNVVTVQWTVIRTKVFNKKMTFPKGKKSVLDSLDRRLCDE